MRFEPMTFWHTSSCRCMTFLTGICISPMDHFDCICSQYSMGTCRGHKNTALFTSDSNRQSRYATASLAALSRFLLFSDTLFICFGLSQVQMRIYLILIDSQIWFQLFADWQLCFSRTHVESVISNFEYLTNKFICSPVTNFWHPGSLWEGRKRDLNPQSCYPLADESHRECPSSLKE